jgi:hypothetical protein
VLRESQFSYLKRHYLLFPGEEKLANDKVKSPSAVWGNEPRGANIAIEKVYGGE